jgi:hypothetical protein
VGTVNDPHAWVPRSDRTTPARRRRGAVLGVRSSKPGPVSYLQMTLRGAWHGDTFTVSDGGCLTRDFQPDGRPPTRLGSAQPKDAATFALTARDFAKDCASVTHRAT